MNTPNHTSDCSKTETLPGNKKAPVYLCTEGQPVASVAEWVMASWCSTYEREPVAMVLVGQNDLSAFTSALRTRFLNLPPIPNGVQGDSLSASVQMATDSGACLIAGGHDGQACLVTNTQLSARLLDGLHSPAPLLLVVCQEENSSAVDDLAERLRFYSFPPQA